MKETTSRNSQVFVQRIEQLYGNPIDPRLLAVIKDEAELMLHSHEHHIRKEQSGKEHILVSIVLCLLKGSSLLISKQGLREVAGHHLVLYFNDQGDLHAKPETVHEEMKQ